MKIKNKVVILGGGFIGKALALEMCKSEHIVTIIDRNVKPIFFCDSGINWIQSNVEDSEVLISALSNSDVVYHLLSGGIPAEGEDSNYENFDRNIGLTMKVFEACLQANIKRIVFASSAAVYGIQHSFPIKEAASTLPISEYGINKLAIEKYLFYIKKNKLVDVKVARIANPYGPGQALDKKQGFVAIVIERILSSSPLVLYGDQKIIRDFIYINDLVSGLIKVGLTTSSNYIFNLGSGIGVDLEDVLSMTLDIVGASSVNIIRKPKLDHDIPKSVLDISLASEKLNFSPTTLIKDGLIKTLKYHNLPLN